MVICCEKNSFLILKELVLLKFCKLGGKRILIFNLWFQ